MKKIRNLILLLLPILMMACQEQVEHMAPAIHDEDSVATMTSYGVNTLISDSGVIKYRIVAERWEANDKRNPSRWIFDKGIFMTQFDEKFHVQTYIQSDTAYHYDKLRLWELRGRVKVLTKDGLHFASEQLFYDMARHEFYSHVYSKLITPERTLEGSYFRSDEYMTRYYVSNTSGEFEKSDFEGDDANNSQDTAKAGQPQRPLQQPFPRLVR